MTSIAARWRICRRLSGSSLFGLAESFEGLQIMAETWRVFFVFFLFIFIWRHNLWKPELMQVTLCQCTFHLAAKLPLLPDTGFLPIRKEHTGSNGWMSRSTAFAIATHLRTEATAPAGRTAVHGEQGTKRPPAALLHM